METVQIPLITEEQIVKPAKEILEQVIPGNSESLATENLPKTFTQSLDELFPEQQHEEKSIQQAKDILGVLAKEFTSDQLRDVVTEIQFLADSWLDDFERKTFKGLTLNELLHEKGAA